MTDQRRVSEVARWTACALAVAFAAPAGAHHSRAAYDSTVEVEIEGVIANVAWTNPHVYISLEVADSGGGKRLQQIEVGPLSTLAPLGLSREVLAPGDRVTVRANPNRRGPGYIVVGLDVTKSDGAIYPLHVFGRNPPPPPARKAESLAGKWVPTTEGWREVTRGSRSWPVTEVGRQALADAASQLVSQTQCTPWPARQCSWDCPHCARSMFGPRS